MLAAASHALPERGLRRGYGSELAKFSNDYNGRGRTTPPPASVCQTDGVEARCLPRYRANAETAQFEGSAAHKQASAGRDHPSREPCIFRTSIQSRPTPRSS
jgi:hypothetical protein